MKIISEFFLSFQIFKIQCKFTFIAHFSVSQSINQFSYLVMSNSLQPHGMQHARLPCPSPIPGACSNSCSLSRWCHPTISSSVTPFSSCLQSFPESGSFPMSQFFASDSQRSGVSASTSVLLLVPWELIKLISFCTEKETINKIKRQPMNWENGFVNDATDKGLIFKI